MAGLIAYLSQFITANKKAKIADVLSHRTRSVTLVLEDIYKSHNASAVLRTADCMGVQDIHIIENRNTYQFNPHVLRGSNNWLTLNRYNSNEHSNTAHCLNQLKKEGYKILVTSLDAGSKKYNTLPYDDKYALVLGTEYLGVSKEAIGLADELIHIPMVGFTESYNVSVSAAILLSHIMPSVKDSNPNWSLNNEEKQRLTFLWYKSVIKRVEHHIATYLKG